MITILAIVEISILIDTVIGTISNSTSSSKSKSNSNRKSFQ